MGRWQPDARGRLSQAAMELYAERGFEQATVAEIAERAGVTERTFFRYFTDKREVLFDGSEVLRVAIVAAVVGAPVGARTIEVVAMAVEAAASVLQPRREHARRRAVIVAANPSLQERELLKFSLLSAAVTAGLVARGTPELAARLAADAGVSIFGISFERWIADGERRDYVEIVREGFAELATVTAGGQ